MPMIRLDKFLSDSGMVSRREAKELLKAGRVILNGSVCRAGDTKIDPGTAEVTADGKAVLASGERYFLLNKPLGVITATEDTSQKTVIDLLTPEQRRLGLFPVGRLDKDTTGLLLLTNDGDYAHRVISPKKQVYKVYIARVDAPLEEADISRFAAGLALGDGTLCLPGKLDILEPQLARVTICEGKYHQVRRMLAACGKYVTELRRVSIGALALPESLPEGQVIELSKAEADKAFESSNSVI
ncbi:MAG: pseudouridine synthase [Candidatus Heteroscillospira sp.]|jgi:16S rRNA pseudouridine516 synthase